MAMLREVYFANAADQRFESKLFNIRHRLYSYAIWKKSVDPSFKVDLNVFKALADRQKLRV